MSGLYAIEVGFKSQWLQNFQQNNFAIYSGSGWVGRNIPKRNQPLIINIFRFLFTGDPLYVGMDMTIASFDSISEVNMVRIFLNLLKQKTHFIKTLNTQNTHT